MEQFSKNPNSKQDDDRLADFTDQVLEGKLKQAESNVDEELLSLEETILRLKQSLPSTPLDQATVKQMQIRLNARIRREGQAVPEPFWKKWTETLFRPQVGMAFAVVAVLIALVVFSPSVSGGSSAMTGTALGTTSTNSTANILIASILAGAVLIFFWIKRPK